MATLQPQGEYIILKNYKEKYTGGLLQGAAQAEKHALGEIVACGAKVEGYKPGDLVLYEEFEGSLVPKIKGLIDEEYVIIHARCILAIVS